MHRQVHASSRWRPVCLAVQADEGVDAAAVKQWLLSKQALKVLDLSDQGLASCTGPIAESLAADKQARMRHQQPSCLRSVDLGKALTRNTCVGGRKLWHRICT